MELEGKVVVITGGSKGLGSALAMGFLKEGCKTVISSRSPSESTDTSSNTGATWVKADVRIEEEVMALAAEAVRKFGKIDVWVNNAGVRIPHNPIEDTDWKRAHEMMEVNYFGTVYGSKAALLQMKKQGSGTIINILSTSALQGRPNSSAYAASKYAAKGFTDSLRAESKDCNITVVSVYPGGMKTRFFDEQVPDDYNAYMDPGTVASKIIENVKAGTPLEELIIRRPSV
jgi:NAD(P)-dependent dehydrogenase (short-subunit alcohol dehydrogenase family)